MRARRARGAARRWPTPSFATDVGVAIDGERIAAVGPRDELRDAVSAAPTRSTAAAACSRPGSSTRIRTAMFGRPRYDEQEMRAAGLDYMEIARRGGGIHSSVRDLRARVEDELFELARAAAARLASFGTTTVEVKSGYGLTLDDELKTLRVIARLAARAAAAHRPDVPRRARDPARAPRVARRRARRTSTSLIHEMIPAVAAEQSRALRRRLLRDRRLHGRREPRDSHGGARRRTAASSSTPTS